MYFLRTGGSKKNWWFLQIIVSFVFSSCYWKKTLGILPLMHLLELPCNASIYTLFLFVLWAIRQLWLVKLKTSSTWPIFHITNTSRLLALVCWDRSSGCALMYSVWTHTDILILLVTLHKFIFTNAPFLIFLQFLFMLCVIIMLTMMRHIPGSSSPSLP